MPRSMWKGAIGFGLVSVPVQLVPAVQEHGIQLHQVHDEDGGRIRQERICDSCGEIVDYEHVARGADRDGQRAVLTDDLMAELPLPSKKLIDVLAFIDADEIDPLQLDKPYLLQPEGPAASKPYVLLRETLRQTNRVAVTKIALRTKESLALLRVHGPLLALHTMYWPDEVRDPAGLAPPASVTVRPQEMQMAASLMERMSEGFDLDALVDDYQEALRELVESKVDKRRPAPRAETAPAPGNIVDLMAALKASIDRADQEDTPPAKAPAKKTAGKKAAASRTPAKKGAKRTG
ncbi:Ku protein [Streptomyces sp. NPDC049577]|uniref:non-homologous end joining protein Ku n=1 Tax=Streptomyces sp. NPDC049577 TaxID=3155153 RepID=UPI00343F719F